MTTNTSTLIGRTFCEAPRALLAATGAEIRLALNDPSTCPGWIANAEITGQLALKDHQRSGPGHDNDLVLRTQFGSTVVADSTVLVRLAKADESSRDAIEPMTREHFESHFDSFESDHDRVMAMMRTYCPQLDGVTVKFIHVRQWRRRPAEQLGQNCRRTGDKKHRPSTGVTITVSAQGEFDPGSGRVVRRSLAATGSSMRAALRNVEAAIHRGRWKQGKSLTQRRGEGRV